jgi:glycosyltransferase involved in cell wall biosynthesis
MKSLPGRALAPIDVVVCAHNEAEHLPRLLESFRAQTVPSDRYRVILVDNASTDDTARVVADLTRTLGIPVTYVYEADLSYSAAMNAGFREARTEYVAHTDAHCVVGVDWIERIGALTAEMQPDVCGGPYFPFSLVEPPAWFRYNRMEKGSERRVLDKSEFLSGANLVWKRSVVEELGGFGAVGLVGRGLLRGDETQLLLRLRAHKPSCVVVYDPSLVIHHLTRPETTSIGYWIERTFQQGRNHSAVYGSSERERVRDGFEILARSAYLVGAGISSLVLRDRARFPYWQNYWFERLLPQIYKLGELTAAFSGSATSPSGSATSTRSPTGP